MPGILMPPKPPQDQRTESDRSEPLVFRYEPTPEQRQKFQEQYAEELQGMVVKAARAALVSGVVDDHCGPDCECRGRALARIADLEEKNQPLAESLARGATVAACREARIAELEAKLETAYQQIACLTPPQLPAPQLPEFCLERHPTTGIPCGVSPAEHPDKFTHCYGADSRTIWRSTKPAQATQESYRLCNCGVDPVHGTALDHAESCPSGKEHP